MTRNKVQLRITQYQLKKRCNKIATLTINQNVRWKEIGSLICPFIRCHTIKRNLWNAKLSKQEQVGITRWSCQRLWWMEGSDLWLGTLASPTLWCLCSSLLFVTDTVTLSYSHSLSLSLSFVIKVLGFHCCASVKWKSVRRFWTS